MHITFRAANQSEKMGYIVWDIWNSKNTRRSA